MRTDFGAVSDRPTSSEGVAEAQALADRFEVHLTAREVEVLGVLIARADRVVQRHDLYRAVWGGSMPYRDRSVDVIVKRIRQKLAEAAPCVAYLHTQYGVGYRYSPQARDATPSSTHRPRTSLPGGCCE
jgi:DNA-binding response OmpR family regulator